MRSAATAKVRLAAILDAAWCADAHPRAWSRPRSSRRSCERQLRPTRRGAPRRRRPRSTSSPWCGEKTDGCSPSRSTAASPIRCFDAQSVFRAVMDAMARPGTVQAIGRRAEPPQPLSTTAAAVALTLCDHDTPLWLDPALRGSRRGHRLAPLPHRRAARDIPRPRRISRWSRIRPALIALENFAQGTHEYPDRSTTLILQVDEPRSGASLAALEGPGIEDREASLPQPLPRHFVAQWTAEPRPLSARCRPRARRAGRASSACRAPTRIVGGGLIACMSPSRAARPPSPMPIGCSPTAGAATAPCRRSGSTRSSSSSASPSTASWAKARSTTASSRRSPSCRRAAT